LFVANDEGGARSTVTEFNAAAGPLVQIIGGPQYKFSQPALLASFGPDLFFFVAPRQALPTGAPPDNIRGRNWRTVQRPLWTRNYSSQPAENIGLVPQYFALALTDLVVETADSGVGAGAGPDLGQRVELAPNLFGLRYDLGLRFGGAVGHPWELPRPAHR
jgi:hypothetical protein